MPKPADTPTEASEPVEVALEPVEQDGAPRARPDLKRLIVDNPRTVGAAALLVLGIVFVMLGWYGAANTNIITEQIPYLISGGLLGLGLIVVAGFMAGSAMVERRTEQLRRDLLDALEHLPAGDASANGTARRSKTKGSATGTVYVLAGGHSYHLAGCPIIEGKENVSDSTARKAIADGFEMCKLCGPE